MNDPLKYNNIASTQKIIKHEIFIPRNTDQFTKGTFIIDVPRFLAISDLPTYLPCPTL